MAKTAEEFLEYIRDSDYPDSLRDTVVGRAFNEAVVDMAQAVPAIKTGVFDVVQGQMTYDVFGRDARAASNPPPTELVDAQGFRAITVTWSIQPDHTTDPFFQGPFLGPYNGRPLLPFSTSSMWRPSDAIIFESDLASVHESFFQSQWEHKDSDPGSPVNLVPLPGAAGIAGIQYYAYRSLDEYLVVGEFAYTKFAEARCCRALARAANKLAGVEFAVFKDTGKSVIYWSQEADRLEKEAKTYLELIGFQEIPAASRSGVAGGPE